MKTKINKNKAIIAVFIIAIVVIADQALKIHIKTTMTIGEQIKITDWMYLSFVENFHMITGKTFINNYTDHLLRIVGVVFLCYGLWLAIKRKASLAFVIFLSLICGGGIGNSIDNLFYGLLFTNSTHYDIATLALGNGYGKLLTGGVVDMIWIPSLNNPYPWYMPLFGHFNYNFNIADLSSDIGFWGILIFCLADLKIYNTKRNLWKDKIEPWLERHSIEKEQ